MRRWAWWSLSILLVCALAAILAQRALVKHGHPGLSTFLRQWARNYPKSFAMHPPVLRITVADADMEVLEGVVERARERGVIESDDGYVPGEFEAAGRTFKGKLRIKGKMTDHVQGDKWSLRVIARKDGGFLGMKRFSLQHPGTRNYLCDWFYHRLMQGEGLIALRYGFCKVVLNDEDLGVYAYEEHFGPELLENNGRLPGPIVRFDPSLFWQHRLNGLEGIKVDDAYGTYQAAALDAFDTGDIAKDPKRRAEFEQAIALVDAFRTGRRKASEVFDVDRTARRLAIIDLVGGHHSLDWSDVKFYFDPAAQRLEPISYESFSAYPTPELAGAYRYTGAFAESDDLHTALLKDPAVFAAYVHHLERLSNKAYLDSAFAALQGPLDTASATLYGEFPYKELDRGIYYRNQQAIRTLLGLPKGFHAYDQGVRHDSLTLLLVPVESLPVQVDTLLLPDGRRIPAPTGTILPSRPRGRVGVPVEVRFPVGAVSDSLLAEGLRVSCRVLGASQSRTVDVFPFTYRPADPAPAPLSTLATVPFIDVDAAEHRIHIRPGMWTLDHDLAIPTGYVVTATAPLQLDLRDGAGIRSRSPFQWTGTEEAPIRITSTDSTSGGIQLVDAGASSRLVHVEVMLPARAEETAAGLSFHRSDATLEHCAFTGAGRTLVEASLGELDVDECHWTGGKDQLRLQFARVRIVGTRFTSAQDDAITAEGGELRLDASTLGDCGGIAIKASVHAQVTLKECSIRTETTGLEGKEGAVIIMTGGALAGTQAAHAGKDEMRYGPVRILLDQVSVAEGATYKCGKGSVIKIDGRTLSTAEQVP